MFGEYALKFAAGKSVSKSHKKSIFLDKELNVLQRLLMRKVKGVFSNDFRGQVEEIAARAARRSSLSHTFVLQLSSHDQVPEWGVGRPLRLLSLTLRQ